MHMTGVQFLVRFNNFDQTICCPFLCTLAHTYNIPCLGGEVLPVTTFLKFHLVKVLSQQCVSAKGREQSYECVF